MTRFFWKEGRSSRELRVGHASPILCASFSPTGKLLATGSGDNTARLWNLDTETPQSTLAGHTGWVLCVEWEAMERTVATGSMDNTVRFSFHVGTGSAGDELRELWGIRC